MLSPSCEANSELSLLDHYCRGDILTLSYRFYAICVKFDLTNPYRNVRVLTNFHWVLSPSWEGISELSLLDHYCRGDILTPSCPWYPILFIWFSKTVPEKSCLDQFLTECYLRSEELSPSYPCYITMAEVIFLLRIVPDILFY